MNLNLSIVRSEDGQRLPAQVRLKGWKPFQDLRMVRRNAFKYAKEFKLKDGECIVVTNSQWRSTRLRKFCLIIQTKSRIPMICYLPTVKVSLLESVTIELHQFLDIMYGAKARRRAYA